MDHPTLLLADDRPRIKDSVTLLLATYFTVGAVADGAAFIAQELKPEVVVVDLTMEPTRSAWAVDELLRIDNQPDIDWDTPAWETVRASELELHERPQGTLTAWPQRLTVAGSVRRHSTRGVNPAPTHIRLGDWNGCGSGHRGRWKSSATISSAT